MNDSKRVKIILDYLKNNTFIPDETGRKYKILHSDEVRKLLDYITNLQQEIERLNKRIKELEEGFKASTEDLCEESTKIEKAIEYIKQKEINVFYQELGLQQMNAKKELLEILQGSDKE